MVIFTQYVVPGDVVDVQITRKKHHYMEGRVVKIHRFQKNDVKRFVRTMACVAAVNGKYCRMPSNCFTNRNR